MLLRLRKTLASLPVTTESSLRIRIFRGDEDIAAWLEVRKKALAGQIAPGREWTEDDFRREFLNKPWWRPDWMWFAEEEGSPIPAGAVALRPLEMEPNAASIQWLLVVPEQRRRGVGRELLASLETAAWENGYRTIIAETLDVWDVAVRFYEKAAYRRVEV